MKMINGFFNILNIEHIKNLQEYFNTSLKIEGNLFDANNKPVFLNQLEKEKFEMNLDIENYIKFRDFHFIKALELLKDFDKKNISYEYQVESTGIYLNVFPVFKENEHIGTWVIGFYLKDKVTEPQKENLLKITQLNSEQVDDVYKEMAINDKKTLNNIIVYLGILSEILDRLGSVENETISKNKELVLLEEKQTENIEIIENIANNSGVEVVIVSQETEAIIYANKMFLETYCNNESIDKIYGKKLYNILGIDKNIVFTEEEYYIEKTNKWVRFYLQDIKLKGKNNAKVISIFDDTHNKDMKNQLYNIAYLDKKLNIQNKFKFENDIINHNINENIFIVAFDITSMRNINYSYSRNVGDDLLTEIKEFILSIGISFEDFYRMDGAEFFIKVRTNLKDAEELGEKIYKRFEKTWEIKTLTDVAIIYCAIGVGIIEHTTNEINKLYDKKNKVIGLSKTTGKIEVFNEELDKILTKEKVFENALKFSVLTDMSHFEILYEPIVNMGIDKWVGIEASSRWNCKDFGIVSPKLIVPALEKFGLISRLDLWVLESAIINCKKWKLDLVYGFILDVNISPNMFMDPNLDKTILELVAKHNFPHNKIVLEITESTEFNLNEYSLVIIQKLKEKGIGIAIDNFGSGYSAFDRLNTLPISYLKTNKHYIKNIEDDSYLEKLYNLTFELARTADMNLIAEGVDTKEQMEILYKNDIEYMQGKLFAKPMNADEMAQNLDKFQLKKEITFKNYYPINIENVINENNSYVIWNNYKKLMDFCMETLFFAKDFFSVTEQLLLEIVETLKFEKIKLIDISNSFLYKCDDDNFSKFKLEEKIVKNLVMVNKFMENENKDCGIFYVINDSVLHKKVKESLNYDINYAIAIPIYHNKELAYLFVAEFDYIDKLLNAKEMQTIFNIVCLFSNVIKREKLNY